MGKLKFFYLLYKRIFQAFQKPTSLQICVHFVKRSKHGDRSRREPPGHFRSLRNDPSSEGHLPGNLWSGLFFATDWSLSPGRPPLHCRNCAGCRISSVDLPDGGAVVDAPPRGPTDRQAEDRQHHREDGRRLDWLHGRRRPHQDQEAFPGVGKDRGIDRTRFVIPVTRISSRPRFGPNDIVLSTDTHIFRVFDTIDYR